MYKRQAQWNGLCLLLALQHLTNGCRTMQFRILTRQGSVNAVSYTHLSMRILNGNDCVLLSKSLPTCSLDSTATEHSALHRDRPPISAGQMEWEAKRFIPLSIRILSGNDCVLLSKSLPTCRLDSTATEHSALYRDRPPVSAGQMEWEAKRFIPLPTRILNGNDCAPLLKAPQRVILTALRTLSLIHIFRRPLGLSPPMRSAWRTPF